MARTSQPSLFGEDAPAPRRARSVHIATGQRATYTERLANYQRVMGKHPWLFEEGRWVTGGWLLTDYQRHDVTYHGAYPRHLLSAMPHGSLIVATSCMFVAEHFVQTIGGSPAILSISTRRSIRLTAWMLRPAKACRYTGMTRYS
jgi:hypothetical protein